MAKQPGFLSLSPASPPRAGGAGSRVLIGFLAVVVGLMALAGGAFVYGVEGPAPAKESESALDEEVGAGSPLEAVASRFPASGFEDGSEQAAAVRDFVHGNSLHEVEGADAERAWNTTWVIESLHRHAEGEGPPPELSCGPRAQAMRLIMAELGHETRTVHLFTDDHDNIRSHTFVEAWDPEERRWEAYDPDFGIHYVDAEAEDTARLATRDLVFGDVEAAIPCDGGEICDWAAHGVEHLRDGYFEAVMYDHRLDDGDSQILVNSERFDTEKVFPENGNMTFTEFVEKQYERTTIVRF